jgi:hypothetical protein
MMKSADVHVYLQDQNKQMKSYLAHTGLEYNHHLHQYAEFDESKAFLNHYLMKVRNRIFYSLDKRRLSCMSTLEKFIPKTNPLFDRPISEDELPEAPTIEQHLVVAEWTHRLNKALFYYVEKNNPSSQKYFSHFYEDHIIENNSAEKIIAQTIYSFLFSQSEEELRAQLKNPRPNKEDDFTLIQKFASNCFIYLSNQRLIKGFISSSLGQKSIMVLSKFNPDFVECLKDRRMFKETIQLREL